MNKIFVQKLLKFSAKLAIKRNGYKIVAITGSAGKTTTKKAITLVLAEKHRVLSTEEGYNTEIGLPLILLEKKTPKSKLGWLTLAACSPIYALKKRNYDYCILEMGVDRPGDMDRLTAIANPGIAVITSVLPVHLRGFGSLEEIGKEKERILKRLNPGGVAIMNGDDDNVANIKVPEGAKRINFGKKSKEIKIVKQVIRNHTSFNYFEVEGRPAVVESKALGNHILYAFASALAVGFLEEIEADDMAKALGKFKPVKGRLNLIEGINESRLIDDSYNANPASMKNSLDLLSEFGGRKIAVHGTMGDLGDQEGALHEEIGRYLVGKCDILVTVGEEAEKFLASSSIREGLKKDNVYSFKNSLEAGRFLKEFIEKGDIVLVKGSQNTTRMERTVKEIMKHSEDAGKLLVRQGKEWEKRK